MQNLKKKKKLYFKYFKSPPWHTPNPANLHIRKQQLEPIAQRAHVRVRVALQLEALWYDLDVPVLQRGILPCFEAEVKVAGVFGVDAEGVHGAFGVGHGVGFQPFVYKSLASLA